MLYIRKLFTQDLRDGKQIAFPKEPSLFFFDFDYANKEPDRKIGFTFRAPFNEFSEYESKVITSRLYAAGSESRMDGEVKAFIRDLLNAQVNDLLIFKNKGTKHTDFEVMFLPQSNSLYPLILSLTNGDNHTVCSFDTLTKSSPLPRLPLQRIHYGPPGTGKSNAIKELTGSDGSFGKDHTFRTTFHPDSDYSTFVGAYKPMWDKGLGKITYSFRPQSFLRAYVDAWLHPGESVTLVIEEINRGNCAQIFGDIFQLLDRETDGLSKYPIDADEDMKDFLAAELAAMPEEGKASIDAYYASHYDSAFDKIRSGEILALPRNLSLLATMNTSDQSLFPMDSAFKRRWEWHYSPIADAGKGWTIAMEGYEPISWWAFLERVNAVIADLTSSEDKQLGYFFCMPEEEGGTVITAERFVNKVIFYLWNDIFKDYGLDVDCCRRADDSNILFTHFYGADGVSVNIATVAEFMNKLSKAENAADLAIPLKKANAKSDANDSAATDSQEDDAESGAEGSDE